MHSYFNIISNILKTVFFPSDYHGKSFVKEPKIIFRFGIIFKINFEYLWLHLKQVNTFFYTENLKMDRHLY